MIRIEQNAQFDLSGSRKLVRKVCFFSKLFESTNPEMKTKEFRIRDNRLIFKCPRCGYRRNYTLFNVRRKNIKCDGCGDKIRCLFNRRPELRESQRGLLTVKTRDGKEITVMMRDISSMGIGFEVQKGKDLRSIKKGQEISCTSDWNPRMIRKSRFKVQNINGFRVGAMAKR